MRKRIAYSVTLSAIAFLFLLACTNNTDSDKELLPDTPTNFSVEATTASSVEITWNIEGETEEVELRKSTSLDVDFNILDTIPKTEQAYTDNDLEENKKYYYKIRASNSYGYSEWSEVLIIKTQQLNLDLEVPSNLSVNIISWDSIELLWDYVSDNNEIVIQRKTGTSGTFNNIDIITSDQPSFTDSNLKAETQYFYRIAASDGSSSSEWSTEIECTTPPHEIVSLNSLASINFSYTADDAAGKSLVWFNTEDRNNIVQSQSLSDGENSIVVDKEGVYLVALVENDAQTRNMGSARSISDSISSLGNIHVVDSGLDTIPIKKNDDSNNDTQQVELGDVTVNETEKRVESNADTTVISEGTGHTTQTIEQYGNYDQILNKYYSLDIDSNGTMDSEDGLKWNLITEATFSVNAGDFDFSTYDVNIAPQDMAYDEFQWMFKWFSPSDYTDENYYSDNLNNRLKISSNSSGTLELQSTGGMSGSIVYYYFPVNKSSLMEIAPIDGTYEIQLGPQPEGHYFTIEDIHFVTPGENFENFVFPVVRADVDASDVLQSVSWRWKKVSNGSYIDVPADEVKLEIRSMIIAFQTNHNDQNNTLAFYQTVNNEPDVWIQSAGDTQWYPFRLSSVTDLASTNDYDIVNLGTSYYEDGSVDTASHGFELWSDDEFTVIIEDTSGNYYEYIYKTH